MNKKKIGIFILLFVFLWILISFLIYKTKDFSVQESILVKKQNINKNSMNIITKNIEVKGNNRNDTINDNKNIIEINDKNNKESNENTSKNNINTTNIENNIIDKNNMQNSSNNNINDILQLNKIQRVKERLSLVSNVLSKDVFLHNEKYFNILLFGKWWNNWYGWWLTDSIMAVTFNIETKKVFIFSVPRDLYVDWYWKINSVYYYIMNNRKLSQEEKDTKLLQTYSDLLWIPFWYYSTIDFSNFEALINKIWWVDLNIEENIYWYWNLMLKPWEQHLDWATALKYVRTRYQDSDYYRTQRQQNMIKAIFKKMNNISVDTIVWMLDFVNKIEKNIDMWQMLKLLDYYDANLTINSFTINWTCLNNSIDIPMSLCLLWSKTHETYWYIEIPFNNDYWLIQYHLTYLIENPNILNCKVDITSNKNNIFKLKNLWIVKTHKIDENIENEKITFEGEWCNLEIIENFLKWF